ncbi:hypothetical protein BGW80DRAFT_1384609 [Lactifluus volemus]|nr:hypothetical protein BGW80DRAFT_1384609 [Lactifluus volemus]
MVLAGLLRLRLGGGGIFDLGIFLWKQVGIIWLSLVVFAGIPPAVNPFNFMFQIPSLISMTIAATRMYRSLIHFSSDTSGLPLSRISFAKGYPLSPMNVATRGDDSFPRKTHSRSLDEQLVLEPEEDVNSSKEKVVSIVESPV